MPMKQKENIYISPSIEVMEVIAECGFATSYTPDWDGGFGDETPIS